jgi:spermidine/putrescine transport system permease protein
VPGILAASVITALPMFGDYYTNTILSGSPGTDMVGNQIELYITALAGAAEGRGAWCWCSPRCCSC